MTYKGTYTDKFGIQKIEIFNDFKNLSLKIDNVKFAGSEFSDLTVVNLSEYSENQLSRFEFLSIPIEGISKKLLTLCDCSFNITIQQTIINLQDKSTFDANLIVNYTLGKPRKNNNGLDFEQVKLSLIINEIEYKGKADFFEIAFDQIQKQFKKNYHFKNCYGCMFGDYSIYGQSSFGTMQCFVNQKERYLQVKTKKDYLMKLDNNYQQVQEIFSCPKFEVRKGNIGYRG